MATFREYIASLGAAGAVPEAELDELLGRYEWFALARLVRLRQRGGDPSEDGRLGFAVQDRAAGTAPEVDRERLTALCADDLIDDFLRAGDYRIVAEEGEADDEVKTVADFDDEDDLVTEELAEIYRQQGLNDEACAIYRKLSLRNPEKSVYFAELIDEIASRGRIVKIKAIEQYVHFCIVVILLASVSLIFVVLVQSPKGGMAANFGAANQVMGVRDAANGLEKFTWAMALVIVVLSLVATLSMDKGTVAASNKDLEKDANALIEMTQEAPVMPQAVPAEAPASEQPAADQQQ